MQNELMPVQVSPEALTILNTYLENGCNMKETAAVLGYPVERVSQFLAQRQVKNIIDQQFAEAGFRNRDRMFGLMDEIINAKIEELEETQMLPEMDIITIMEKYHKMKMQELQMSIKLQEITNNSQTNIQNNINIAPGGKNYNSLLERIMTGGGN